MESISSFVCSHRRPVGTRLGRAESVVSISTGQDAGATPPSGSQPPGAHLHPCQSCESPRGGGDLRRSRGVARSGDRPQPVIDELVEGIASVIDRRKERRPVVGFEDDFTFGIRNQCPDLFDLSA